VNIEGKGKVLVSLEQESGLESHKKKKKIKRKTQDVSREHSLEAIQQEQCRRGALASQKRTRKLSKVASSGGGWFCLGGWVFGLEKKRQPHSASVAVKVEKKKSSMSTSLSEPSMSWRKVGCGGGLEGREGSRTRGTPRKRIETKRGKRKYGAGVETGPNLQKSPNT